MINIQFLSLTLLVLSGTAVAQETKKQPGKGSGVDLSVNFDHKGFIRVQNGKFVDEDCREYHFTGWNAWGLVDTGTYVMQLPREATAVKDGKNPIEWMFDEAVEAGLSVMRFFGHPAIPQLQLQTSPGQYNENSFKGLDYVLAEAGKRGIKLIISFSTNWKDVDGKRQYLRWAKNPESQDEFWIDPEIKQVYKNHMTVMATRVNSITGVAYKDDPVIFAWNLFNEVRCGRRYCENASVRWYHEMAAHLKSVDPNHMVTTGEEGFYAWGCPLGEDVNPLVEAVQWGQDFIRDHSTPDIDFAVIHLWPNNWAVADDPAFPLAWIRKHTKDSERFIKKPLVLEEFGIQTEDNDEQRKAIRNPFFKKIFNEVETNLDNEGALKSAMFWEWHINDKKKKKKHAVTVGDTSWQILAKHAENIAQRNAKRKIVEFCKPGTGNARVESVDPNNRVDIDSCCDKDCRPMWADLKGDTYQESVTATAGDCCRSCKFANVRARSVVCTHWSWCSCDDCGGYMKGTCRLKTQKNPFYPQAWVRGNRQPWISGIAGKFAQEWKCQPKGGCAFNPDCADFGNSLSCVNEQICGADQFRLISYDAEKILEFSVNARVKRPYGEENPPPVTTAAQCCDECRKNEKCNGWRFCFKDGGCPIGGRKCSEKRDEYGLGKHEECGSNDQWPRMLCTLYQNVDFYKETPIFGEGSEWVSGVLPNRRSFGK